MDIGMAIDVKTMAGIVLVTVLLVEVLKAIVGERIKKSQKWISVLFPVLIACASKGEGNFKDVGWLELVLFAIIAGFLAGVAHDKGGVSLLRRKIASLLGKKGGP